MDAPGPVRFLKLEVARLKQEKRDLKDELTTLRASIGAVSALQDLIQRITPTSDILSLLDDLLASALEVVGASDGSLLLTAEDTGELVFTVVHGEARARLTGFRLPPGQGIAGWVAANKRPKVVHDVHADPSFYPAVDETIGFQTRSLTCVPLLDGERVVGVIEAINKASDREFSDQDHDLLKVVAQLATVAVARAEAFSDEIAKR